MRPAISRIPDVAICDQKPWVVRLERCPNAASRSSGLTALGLNFPDVLPTPTTVFAKSDGVVRAVVVVAAHDRHGPQVSEGTLLHKLDLEGAIGLARCALADAVGLARVGRAPEGADDLVAARQAIGVVARLVARDGVSVIPRPLLQRAEGAFVGGKGFGEVGRREAHGHVGVGVGEVRLTAGEGHGE